MDGRKNNKGQKGNKGGSPGHGKMSFVRDMVEKHSELWWIELEKMMRSKNSSDKKFAMSEFNKLQAKMVPQDIDVTSDGAPLGVVVLPQKDVDSLEANKQTSRSSKQD
jgi:hypothetical protein